MKFALISLSFALLLIPHSSSARADDWPHWMGPNRDGVWKNDGILDEFPQDGATIVWRQSLGAGYSGPSVASGNVFVMDRTKDEGKGIETENNIQAAGELPGGERLLCLDRSNGHVKWEYAYDCPYNIAYPTGPRCTPAVDGDRVYCLGAMGHLACLSTSDGTVIWKKELTKEFKARPPLWGYASHPLVDGDTLIVPVGGEGSGVVAFDKMSGKEKWRAITTFDIGYSPLLIHESSEQERQLIFWHGEGVHSLDPSSGSENWFVKFPGQKNPSCVTIATPLIINDRLLIAEYYKGAMLLEFDGPNGIKEVWRSQTTDPRNRTSLNCMMATPLVKEGHAYGVCYNSRGGGILRCTHIESGKEIWSKDDWQASKALVFSNAFLTRCGDKEVLFNDLGELMICRLSPEGMTELDRAKIVDPTSAARGRDVVWSHPAYSDTQVFLRNDKEIVCVELGHSAD